MLSSTWKLASTSWRVRTTVLDRQFNSPVRQVLLSIHGDSFLLASTKGDELWTTQGGILGRIDPRDGERQWLKHPHNLGQLLMFQDNSVHIHEWTGQYSKNLISEDGIPIAKSDQDYVSLSREWAVPEDSGFFVNAGRLEDGQDGFVFVDTSQLQPHSEEVATRCVKQFLESSVKSVLSLHKSSFLFLDSRGWICSMPSNLSDAKSYIRHFFVPTTWMAETDLLIKIVSKSSVALVHRDELVVFRGFLDCKEKVPFRKETGARLKRSQTLKAW